MTAVIASLGPITEGRLFELMGKVALGDDHRHALEKLRKQGWLKISKGDANWPSREIEATILLKSIMLPLGIHLTVQFVQAHWGRQAGRQAGR